MSSGGKDTDYDKTEEKKSVALFDNREIRTLWDDKTEQWYFSIVDVIAVLTDSTNPRKYWSVLKNRLKKEGSEVTTNCSQLKMQAADGKSYLTDVGNTEQILRLIQSVPSKKAEPFKVWLARVGSERIDEISNPELAINRAVSLYQQKGYSEKWINQRIKSIEVRKDLTDEWERSGVSKSHEFAILTDEITKAWSGKSIREYKKFKGLKKESLRDNMTNLELVLNMLAEVTTTELSRTENPEGFSQSRDVARRGGAIAGETRQSIEKQTGKPVISRKNAHSIEELDETNTDNTLS